MPVECAIRATEEIICHLEIGDENPCIKGDHHLQIEKSIVINTKQLHSSNSNGSLKSEIEITKNKNKNYSI